MEKLSEKINYSYFYKDASLDLILQGIDEAVEKYSPSGIYINVLRACIQHERVDVLDKIYDSLGIYEEVIYELKETILQQCFDYGHYKSLEFFIDKGVKTDHLYEDVQRTIFRAPLSLLKKFHEHQYDLTSPKLLILPLLFDQLPACFEKIDYIIEQGATIESHYNAIVKNCFSINSKENEDKIDYLLQKNIDLNREHNLLLVEAVKSQMPELLEYICSKNISLILPENKIYSSVRSTIRDDDIDFFKILLNKNINIDVATEEFAKLVGYYGAINILEFCQPLGINNQVVRTHANENLKNHFVKEIYDHINNGVDDKNKNLPRKKI